MNTKKLSTLKMTQKYFGVCTLALLFTLFTCTDYAAFF